jgi:hypothetical protein|tara:strand:+ start:436 stop:600 length:165 start_codon:yes stop_codon:yes gene_type:complete
VLDWRELVYSELEFEESAVNEVLSVDHKGFKWTAVEIKRLISRLGNKPEKFRVE